mmetsp:Transcript_27618/g.87544  ORF Transcript_27618/g.87544 Transcript_27618/m.87544 type:complete len:229 (-) Transcript_27618:1321-2007(-)
MGVVVALLLLHLVLDGSAEAVQEFVHVDALLLDGVVLPPLNLGRGEDRLRGDGGHDLHPVQLQVHHGGHGGAELLQRNGAVRALDLCKSPAQGGLLPQDAGAERLAVPGIHVRLVLPGVVLDHGVVHARLLHGVRPDGFQLEPSLPLLGVHGHARLLHVEAEEGALVPDAAVVARGEHRRAAEVPVRRTAVLIRQVKARLHRLVAAHEHIEAVLHEPLVADVGPNEHA